MREYLNKLMLKRDLDRKYKALTGAINAGRNVLGRHPLSVQIQTVSVCNAVCYFCPYPESWHRHNPGRMSDEVYRKIIDDIAHYPIGKFCPYLENEPLIDRKIFDRIEYAVSKLDFRVLEVSTNGSLLDADRVDAITRIFPHVKHQLWVSFHGIDEHSFNSIMGLDFETCKENLMHLIEKAQDHNINILIRGAGEPRIRDGKQPVWFTRDQYLAFWKRELDKRGFRRRPNIDAFTYHDRAGEIKRNEVHYTEIARASLKNFYCSRFDQWIHFLYTGELIMCCMDYHRQTVLGDIRTQTVDEIYGSVEYLRWARAETGIDESAADFICKRCHSPGG